MHHHVMNGGQSVKVLTQKILSKVYKRDHFGHFKNAI